VVDLLYGGTSPDKGFGPSPGDAGRCYLTYPTPVRRHKVAPAGEYLYRATKTEQGHCRSLGVSLTVTNPRDLCYEALVAGLRLLGADASVQLSALPDYVYVPDEVLSGLGETFIYLPQLCRGGSINDSAAQAIRAADAFLDEMPTDPILDDPESLRTHPFWARARDLARHALSELGETLEGPVTLAHYERATR
ncbi:MAG: hypothetical protein AB8H86_01165, partial [Polyangiales bacterium]